jgi:hypothetical protein
MIIAATIYSSLYFFLSEILELFLLAVSILKLFETQRRCVYEHIYSISEGLPNPKNTFSLGVPLKTEDL